MARAQSAPAGRPQENFLRTKFQIGSCRADRKNYRHGERVFHASDVPGRVLHARRAVQQSCRPDVLGTARSVWNASTIADQKVQKDAATTDLRSETKRIQAGIYDQPTAPKGFVPEDVDLLRFIATITGKGPVGPLTKRWFNPSDLRGLAAHCAEPDWPDWNASVSTRKAEDVKLKEKRFLERESSRIERNVPSRLINRSTYRNPRGRVEEFGHMLREKKVQYHDLKEDVKVGLRRNEGSACEERLQAMALRLLDEKLLAEEKQRRFPIPHESFKPNLALTTADRRYKEWRHPGKWTWMPTEESYAWSCCLNFGEHSKGCEYRTVDPDAWCFMAGGAGIQ